MECLVLGTWSHEIRMRYLDGYSRTFLGFEMRIRGEVGLSGHICSDLDTASAYSHFCNIMQDEPGNLIASNRCEHGVNELYRGTDAESVGRCG